MNKEELLTFCMSSCGNNMHIECALKWIKHKISQGQKLTCPLCRAEWKQEFYEFIEKQAKENRKRALLLKQKRLREEAKKKEIEAFDNKLPEIVPLPSIEIAGNGMSIIAAPLHDPREERKKPISTNELYRRRPPKDFRVRRTNKLKPIGQKGQHVNPLESLLISGLQLGGASITQALPRTRATSKRLPQANNLEPRQEGLELTGSKIRYRRVARASMGEE